MPKVCRDRLVLFLKKNFLLLFAVTSLQVVLEDILVVDYNFLCRTATCFMFQHGI